MIDLDVMAQRERIWRLSVIALLLLAILGPWGFDRIIVPAQYPCNAPFVRLEGDICGTPMSGFWMLSLIVNEFSERVGGIIRGAPPPIDSGRDYIFTLSLGAFLILLPILSTSLLTLVGNRWPWQFVNIVAWCVALGVGLLMGFATYPKLYWQLWGTWLYIGVAVIAVFIEVLILKSTIRPSPAPSPRRG